MIAHPLGEMHSHSYLIRAFSSDLNLHPSETSLDA